MSKIILISTLLNLLCIGNCDKQTLFNEPGIYFKAILRGSFNLPEIDAYNSENDSIYYFLVEAKLINSTNSSFEFLTYTCTTVGNIVVENKNIAPCVNNCSGNSLITIKLKPKQEFSLTVILKTFKANTYENVKIGWLLLNQNMVSHDDYRKVLEINREKLVNVIWSNPIYLDESISLPYEIRMK